MTVLMVSQKTNVSLAFLQRNLQVGQEHLKTSAYFTLVKPQLEYAAAIWDLYTHTYKTKIDMVQKRAARYVCNNYGSEVCVTTMLNHLDWHSRQQRRADIRLVVL